MSDARITVTGVGKRFPHRGAAAPRTWRRLWSAPRGPAESFWALQDVSFSVRAGEMLGVIGPNGAGKSTLLSLLGGLAEPTVGRLAITGRLGALLELGGGFVDDLSGRENVELAAVVAGLTRAEVRRRLDAIVDFAEMREFVDEPVRTYSSGMRMRLAFSVAVHTSPEILLVDEFLAVGDLSFQARCRERVAELKTAGCAIVLVSHGLGEVRETCDRVLWLRAGRVAALDTAEVVTARYEAEMHERTLQRTPRPAAAAADAPSGRAGERLGSREVEIVRLDLRSGSQLRSGGPLVIDLAYRNHAGARAPIFGISITREDGVVCLDTHTEGARLSTERLPGAGVMRFTIPRLELGAGRYFVNAGIFQREWSHAYDYRWQLLPFTVQGAPEHKGVSAPPVRWEVLPRADGARIPHAATAERPASARPARLQSSP